MDIAQRKNDVALEMRILANAANVDTHHLLCCCVDDLQADVIARFGVITAMHRHGDLEGARGHTAVMLASAQRLRDRRWLTIAYAMLDMICRAEGDWLTARDCSGRGLELFPQDPRFLSCQAVMEFEVGGYDLGESYLERLLQAMGHTEPGPSTIYAFTALVVPMADRISGAVNRSGAVRTAAQAVLGSPSATPLFAAYARIALALLVVAEGDVKAAEEHYGRLQIIRGNMAMSGILGDRVLGLLAHTMGDIKQASAH